MSSVGKISKRLVAGTVGGEESCANTGPASQSTAVTATAKRPIAGRIAVECIDNSWRDFAAEWRMVSGFVASCEAVREAKRDRLVRLAA